jgi:hypothetical protein
MVNLDEEWLKKQASEEETWRRAVINRRANLEKSMIGSHWEKEHFKEKDDAERLQRDVDHMVRTEEAIRVSLLETPAEKKDPFGNYPIIILLAAMMGVLFIAAIVMLFLFS